MILACQKIEKAFGGKSVLNNVNFLINEGEKAAVTLTAVKQLFSKLSLENMRQIMGKLSFRKALLMATYPRSLT